MSPKHLQKSGGETNILRDKNKLSDPSDAFDLIHRLEQSPARQAFARLVTIVQNMVDRKPPQDSGSQDCGEQDMIPNVDWGSMRIEIQKKVNRLVSASTQGAALIRPQSDVAESAPQGAVWMEEFALADARLLKRLLTTDGYSMHLLFAEVFYNREAFGLGVFFRDSPRTLQWGSVHPQDLIFPAGARLNVNEWPFLAVRTFYPIHDLLEWTRDEKAASAVGWNVPAVREFLEDVAEGGLFENASGDDYQEDCRSASLRAEYRERDKVLFYQLLVREWDGSISRHILASSQGGRMNRMHLENARYLFTRREEFSAMSEACCIMPHDIFERHLQKQQGYGEQTLPFHDARNSFINMMIARVLISSGIVFQAEDESSVAEWNKIVFGGISTLIPPGVNVTQTKIESNAGELARIQQTIDGIFHAGNQSMGGEVKAPKVGTLGQAQIAVTQGNQQESIDMEFFFHFLTLFHTARIKGALSTELPKDRVETRERDRMLLSLQNKRVPLESLYGDQQFPYEEDDDYEKRRRAGLFGEGADRIPKEEEIDDEDIIPMTGIYIVEAEPPLGYGDSADQRMRMEAMLSSGMFGRMSPEAQRKFSRRFTALLLSWYHADEAFPRDQVVDDKEAAARQKAQVENTALMTAYIPPIGTDLHLAELETHTQYAMGILQAVRDGAESPETALKALPAMLAHAIGGEETGPGHLAFLQEEVVSNPALEGVVKQFGSQWNIVQNTLRQIQQQQGAAMEAEAAAGQRRIENLSEEDFRRQKREIQMLGEQQKLANENTIQELRLEKQRMENEGREERNASEARRRDVTESAEASAAAFGEESPAPEGEGGVMTEEQILRAFM